MLNYPEHFEETKKVFLTRNFCFYFYKKAWKKKKVVIQPVEEQPSKIGSEKERRESVDSEHDDENRDDEKDRSRSNSRDRADEDEMDKSKSKDHSQEEEKKDDENAEEKEEEKEEEIPVEEEDDGFQSQKEVFYPESLIVIKSNCC